MARRCRQHGRWLLLLAGVSVLSMGGCADWRGFESAWYYDRTCVRSSGGFVGVQGGAEELGFFAIFVGGAAAVAGAVHLLFGGE